MTQEIKERETMILPMIPLRGVMVFPNITVHLDVGRPGSVAALEAAIASDQDIFLAMQKDPLTEEPTLDEIYNVGSIGRINQVIELPGGTVRLVVEGICRAILVSNKTTNEDYILAEVEGCDDNYYQCDELEMEALCRHLKNQFEEYTSINKKIPLDIKAAIDQIQKPGELSDFVANYMNFPMEERQKVLEMFNVKDRIEYLILALEKEIEIRNLDKEIHNRVRQQMDQNQKEYYLREQIKAIQKELGDKDDRDSEVEELRKQMEGRKLPDEVKEKIEKELQRLINIPPQVAEANVIHGYIEWLLDLPWDKETVDNNDIKQAKEMLNQDHYGITEVKERILEHLAVRQLNGNHKGSIMCLVGPPGVGKTSLARSIAKSMGREYVRVSFGGVRDEAEIRGHRRTYIGAMPGRIIQSMKKAGTNNPLFLMDEIDKLANDFRGDPASALLEVLDPEQNNSFSDHYIEVPFDLSKVLFITTANDESAIPGPLRDRMEVIRLSGYTEDEKVNIAIRHLVPKQVEETGLTNEQITFTEQAVRQIVNNYTREAGVRNLQREIEKVCRKVATEIVAKDKESVKITVQNLAKYLGAPRFLYSEISNEDQIGVTTGLAWTSVGGDTLSIEARKVPGKGKLILTGNLGDVMKESAQTAWSFLRSIGEQYNVPDDIEEKYDIHIHVPEGATPKDGPSAGVTISTTLASLFSNRPVNHLVAMTGEVTLSGRVLPIGGLKEKVLAAHRAGCKIIIIPDENRKDLEDIPANVRKKLEFYPVTRVEQVLEKALLPAKAE